MAKIAKPGKRPKYENFKYGFVSRLLRNTDVAFFFRTVEELCDVRVSSSNAEEPAVQDAYETAFAVLEDIILRVLTGISSMEELHTLLAQAEAPADTSHGASQFDQTHVGGARVRLR